MDTLVTLRVDAISVESEVVRSIQLVSRDGSTLPPFTAGSHIDLHFPNGVRRSYSLINNPRETHRYVLGISRALESRGGSAYVHEQLRVGETLTASWPRNTFPLIENAAHTVLIAGGIGITPMLAMIHRLEALGASWELHYAIRSRAAGAFLDRLTAWGDRIRLHADDEAGRPLDLAPILDAAQEGSHLYCCGPAGMLEAFIARAGARAVPSERVHYEYFNADIDAAVEGGFELELRQSGVTLTVPEGKTILDTVLDAGIDAAYNCQEGHCGTCIVRVLEGIPDHRDIYLTEDEQAANDQMTICCSGSKSRRLVLDL